MAADNKHSLILEAAWVLPIEPQQTVLIEHSLVCENGRIIDILPWREARERYPAAKVFARHQHALLPGLINAHTHVAMNLFRGLADDLPLMEWLNEHIWPAEQKWVSDEFCYDGSQLAIAEMLRGGITCFNDMYFFPEATARAASAAGIRATIGMITIDFPSAYAKDADEYLDKGLALHDTYRHDPLIQTAFAPHAPYTVSDGPLQKLLTLANELECPIHMHIHETAEELQQGLERYGKHPLARLAEIDFLGPNVLAVHMTQLTPEEIELVAQQGVNVVHCPESNMKLASGFCPVQALHEAGVNVCLGTDSAASNNDLDMIGEMRSAALLGKVVAGNASALSAHQTLQMATLNGARALGLDQEIGSLVPGKAADIMAVRLDHLNSQPLYDPASHLVYCSSREQISDVWIQGRHLLADGILTTLDEEELQQKARHWQVKIQAANSH